MFAGLDRPVQTDADIAELEVDFCRAVAGSRFVFDEQYYRDIVAADLARGRNPAANAPSASSRIDQLARIRVPTLVVHGTEDPVPTTTPRSWPRASRRRRWSAGRGWATNNLRNWSRS